MEVLAGDVGTVRQRLDALASDDEVVLDTGLWYLPGHAVRIWARKRDGRYDLADGAAAVELARRPGGWLEIMSTTVAPLGMNVNRRGVVFVTGFEGRDVSALALRLAECSRLAFVSLLESGD